MATRKVVRTFALGLLLAAILLPALQPLAVFAAPPQQSAELTIIDQSQEVLALFGRAVCEKRTSTEWIVWHQIVNSNGPNYWDGLKLAQFFKNGRNWSNVGYGYLLDSEPLANGTVKIWQLVPEDCLTWGVGENYNTAGIHMSYVDVPAEAPPNEAQLRTMKLLTRMLMEKHQIPADHVVSHKETALKERGGLGWTQSMKDKWWGMPANNGSPHHYMPMTAEIPAACDNLDDANCVSILNNPHGDPVGLDMDAVRADLGGGNIPIVAPIVENAAVAETTEITGGYLAIAHLSAGARVVATGDNKAEALTEHYSELGPNAYCIANASYWEPNMALTFPYVKQGTLVTKGEKSTSAFNIRVLYLDGDTARVSNTVDLKTSGDMIVGLVPDEASTDARGVTLVGVNASDVYLLVAKETVANGVAELVSRGVAKENIVMLDGGGSSQITCLSQGLVKSDRIIPQGIGIVLPFAVTMAPEASYDPRPAEGDPIRDSTQPLAPMWMDSPTIWWWRAKIYEWAKEWNVNPNGVATIMQIESCGLPTAKSRSNALGLFQVVPRWHLVAGETEDQLYDPDFNADKGWKFYNTCLAAANGDPRRAAACYNGGQSVLTYSEALWPAETKKYAALFQMAFDAFGAAEHSETLTPHVTGGSRPGGLCTKAADWQAAHPREDNAVGGVVYNPSARSNVIMSKVDYDGKTIVIDLPPFVYILVLLLVALAVWYFHDRSWFYAVRPPAGFKPSGTKLVSQRKANSLVKKSTRTRYVEDRILIPKYHWGANIAKVAVAIVIVFWFPLNFGRIFTAMDTGVMPYRNVAFSMRQWVEEKGKPLDQVDDFVVEVQKYIPENVPLPDSWKVKTKEVTSFVKQLRSNKDHVVSVFKWLGDDPILTPFFTYISDSVQEYLVPAEKQGSGNWTVKPYKFESSIFADTTKSIQIRVVVASDGSTNPWGLHGEICYTCSGLRSWLGTDVILLPGTDILSPINGIVENIIIDGAEDVGGSSIWISNTEVRIGLVNINKADATKLTIGQTITAGQKLAEPLGPHLHVVSQVRNQDGSWGDYPLALMLDAFNVPYAWYNSKPPFIDKYVPTADELAKYTEYLIREKEAPKK